MNRFKKFLQTTLLGGVAAILPLGLVIIVFRWIIMLIEKYLRPLVGLFETSNRMGTIIVYLIAVIAVIAVFFLIGLFIRTRFGILFLNYLETNYLSKIPGYKTAREVVKQFFGNNKSFFSEVVLVDVFGCGTLMTGFITDDHGAFVTVFVPTGPNPTSGNIYHVAREKVFKSDTPIDTTIKTIISCGAGSSEVFSNMRKDPLPILKNEEK
ncbi:MAG: DUF502 domain-containing protein [Prolixibacteraceae bacterium]|nr:DUF502 domain-containing protein [Prolixibacteraceae bacterium]